MSNKIFDVVPVEKADSNYFDLTHDVKFSGKMGTLMPIMALECLPGDKFNISAESLIRFAPMTAPVMHRFTARMEYFFVPNRILMENGVFGDWIAGNIQGVAPYIKVQNNNLTPTQIRMLDYMGVPPAPAGAPQAFSRDINAFPFAAYRKIYNEYYRPQDLREEILDTVTFGENSNTLLGLLYRCYEHDYFTSALPFAQKGAPVNLPIGNIVLNNTGNAGRFQRAGSNNPYDNAVVQTNSTGAIVSSGGVEGVYDPNGTLVNDGATINDLRLALVLQKYYELNARGGTRYVEHLRNYWGVTSSDARIQRPEFICRVQTPVMVSEVLNTSGIQGELPQGNMAGHGVATLGGYGDSYTCEEYGFIIGIFSVMPAAGYMDACHKTLFPKQPIEYGNPMFANLGEMEVNNKEIYLWGTQPEGTFGYQSQFAHYKSMFNRVAGEFRSNLDFWNLNRKFANQPNLNVQFLECDPSTTTRIFAVEDADVDNLYCVVLNKIGVQRKLPLFGIPELS